MADKQREFTYRFKEPRTTDERIEAIYEEFRKTSDPVVCTSAFSLKDYLAKLVDEAQKRRWERINEKEDEDRSESTALGLLAFIAAIFLLSGLTSGDSQWKDEHQFAFQLAGMTLTAVYIGVSIERSSFFKWLWRFGFTKLVVSVALSALLIFSTSQASDMINSIFGVDASVFPLTRAYLTVVLALKNASPLLFIVVIFALLSALDVFGYINYQRGRAEQYRGFPVSSVVFLTLALVFLGVAWKWLYKDFTAERLPTKAYQLTHILDFNKNYLCANLEKGGRIVFLGNGHTRVLLDTEIPLSADVESLAKVDLRRDFVTHKFYFLPCELEDLTKTPPNSDARKILRFQEQSTTPTP